MTKYVFLGPMTEAQCGDNVDRKSVLETEDDAARANIGGSIFLPKTDSSEYMNYCYWSSSVVEDTCYFAYAAGFDSSSHSQTNYAYRYTGLTIRPVRD